MEVRECITDRSAVGTQKPGHPVPDVVKDVDRTTFPPHPNQIPMPSGEERGARGAVVKKHMGFLGCVAGSCFPVGVKL